MIFRLRRVVTQYLKNYRRRWLSNNRNSYLNRQKNVVVKLSEQSKFLISLTSVPNRFETLGIVVESLTRQELPANEIHLNLAHQDFNDLPSSIRTKLEQSKVKIFSVDDWGPAKKLIPTLQRSDLPVICGDDDLVYEPTLTLHLMIQARLFPNNVIASRTHKITKNRDGEIAAYSDWRKQYSKTNGPSPELFATSGAGTLFKRDFFHKDVFNFALYKELAFYCDDLWWYFQTIRNGVAVRRVPGAWPLNFIPGTQEQGLWRTGNKERNEVILQNLLKKYGKPF
jgi:hypothetical protein